jgi:hypothetical protein
MRATLPNERRRGGARSRREPRRATPRPKRMNSPRTTTTRPPCSSTALTKLRARSPPTRPSRPPSSTSRTPKAPSTPPTTNAQQEAARRIPDFVDVVGKADIQITHDMLAALKASAHGPDIVYALAKNPAEAKRIAGLPAAQMFMALGAMEAKAAAKAPAPSAASAPAAAAPAARTTSAPPPARPAGAAPHRPTPTPQTCPWTNTRHGARVRARNTSANTHPPHLF